MINSSIILIFAHILFATLVLYVAVFIGHCKMFTFKHQYNEIFCLLFAILVFSVIEAYNVYSIIKLIKGY